MEDAARSPTVALDAMGGDHGPEPVVAGALLAVAAGTRVVLVGDAPILGPLLQASDAADVRVVHAPQWISMAEDPALSVRAKPDASVRVVMRLLREGVAQAGVSAGSTGATLAAALLGLGRLGAVRRPAIAGALPVAGASGKDIILVDAGGSPDIQPAAFVDWARLGIAYARACGAAVPVVGLLNVGSEQGKGNELTRAGNIALQDWVERGDHSSRFIGNIEPVDVLDGRVDVVVTDGFTGNVVIKTLEAAFADRIDAPAGAMIVGVRGTVVVAHGAAGPREIAKAVATAASVSASGWLDEVGNEIA